MHCWMYMSTDRENRKTAITLVYELFGAGKIDPSVPFDCIDKAVRAVTVDSMTLRIKQCLLDTELADEAIGEELLAFESFVIAPHPWAQAFLRARPYDHVAQAILHHLKTGVNEFTPTILHMGCSLLFNFQSMSKETMVTMVDMVQNTPLLEVAAQGLIVANQNQSNDWIKFFYRMTHAIECVNPECEFRATPAYLSACRTRLEPLYVPTRIALATMGSGTRADASTPALHHWEQFAAALGVSETMLLKKWKCEGQCCYPGCTMRACDASTNTKLSAHMKRCGQCKSVWYHGISCQKADWKRHKNHCIPSAQ